MIGAKGHGSFVCGVGILLWAKSRERLFPAHCFQPRVFAMFPLVTMALLDHLSFYAACLAQLSGEAFVHGPCFAVYSLLYLEFSHDRFDWYSSVST